MSEPAPPELSARALIGRVARVYLAPRWKGFAGALLAAVAVAGTSAWLVQILKPATDELLVEHRARALLVLPVTIAAVALARTIAQVAQATLMNRIGNGVVADIQLQLFGKLVRAD